MDEPARVAELLREQMMTELSGLPSNADQETVRLTFDRFFDRIERAGQHVPIETRQSLVWDAYNELYSFGPLGDLLRDPEITEIMVNGPYQIFVESKGVKRRVDVQFADEAELRRVIGRMLLLAPGKRLDLAQPIADLSFPDGSRVCIIVPPAVAGSPHITIRRYTRPVQTLDSYVAMGAMDERMAGFLAAAVAARVNLLFSGAAGSGKTTLLEVLSNSIDEHDRIVVIEDTLELHLRQPNVVRLLTRGSNVEGKGEITIGDLFRASLRMRPSRIVLGEIRGREAFDYLHAVTSGHRGTCAVIHAATPAEAVVRLENLVPYAGFDVPSAVVRRQIADGVGLIVQLTQYSDGVRRISHITAVDGLDDEGFVRLRDLFRFETEAMDAHGRVIGRFTMLPEASAFTETMRRTGVGRH